ncbi:protein COFACTOR ASSEMBLY OF COMPLEX C SUBUNIT B CCB2, chloroplastic-like [Tripterygium wilfordii]|uniref:protein COFACTOR ASSEMBLY OF COMPLEX C SUBUNIT B CCB2, chloroplastic-like n=1 Tax=Tripterygium wilfordii TaxID=458696 RepID=UPI0018F85FFF|nr:protein COFACTOR ASSEMBLY OF COMPLEX C SUBUNIT B CCB2, chloroplastic-like [Tripterygium wilfordii]
MGILCLNPSIQLFRNIPQILAIGNTKFKAIAARLNYSQTTTTAENLQQQLNLSVLRFTLGIPGLDESYLPRWFGYGFGSLLILNHFAGSDAASITPAQMRTEALGLSLAAFSIALPYLGRFLKGATQVDQSTLPEAAEQIFVLSQNISNSEKNDLAWATYVLLRNTNTISVLISVRGQLCVRGYWNTPNDISKGQILDWFQRQIEKIGLSDINDTLYFPQSTDSGLGEMLPNGTQSLLVQPVLHHSVPSAKKVKKVEGFFLLASSMGYAYSDKDRAWIKAIANKFEGSSGFSDKSADMNKLTSMRW